VGMEQMRLSRITAAASILGAAGESGYFSSPSPTAPTATTTPSGRFDLSNPLSRSSFFSLRR
jgi:hypothetical protein